MTDIIQELRGLIAREKDARHCLSLPGDPAWPIEQDRKKWAETALQNAALLHLPALLDRLEAAERRNELIAAMIDGSDGNIPFTTVFVPLIIGHNQPCMSADMRDRLHPHQRRRFDDACKTLAAAIREMKP